MELWNSLHWTIFRVRGWEGGVFRIWGDGGIASRVRCVGGGTRVGKRSSLLGVRVGIDDRGNETRYWISTTIINTIQCNG